MEKLGITTNTNTRYPVIRSHFSSKSPTSNTIPVESIVNDNEGHINIYTIFG